MSGSWQGGEGQAVVAWRYLTLSTPTNCCVTYLPSTVNTWTRLFPRSETYTNPSLDTLTSCGVSNCCRFTAYARQGSFGKKCIGDGPLEPPTLSVIAGPISIGL